MSTLKVPVQINGDLESSGASSNLLERELYIDKDGKLYYGKGSNGVSEIKPSWSIQSEYLGNASYLTNSTSDAELKRLILLSEPTEQHPNLVGRAASTSLTIDKFELKTDTNGDNIVEKDEVGVDRYLLNITDVLLTKIRRLCLATGYSYGTAHPEKNTYLNNADSVNIQKGQLYFRIVKDGESN